jgi:thiol-disulfide isomerase/thioredoxin
MIIGRHGFFEVLLFCFLQQDANHYWEGQGTSIFEAVTLLINLKERMKKNFKKGISLIFALTVVLFQTGFANIPDPVLKTGIWRAVIQRPDGIDIVFNFSSAVKNGKQVMYVMNAKERLLVDDIQSRGDSLWITMPFFSSGLVAKIVSGNRLEGTYFKKLAGRKQEIPFYAVFGQKERYITYSHPQYDINGTWDVTFAGKRKETSKAVGNFLQTKDGKVTGSVLTPSGDYRYLEGLISGDTLKLSGFDGGFATLFTAVITNDSTITSADFYSGLSIHETWTAVKNQSAKLPDEFSYSHVKEGESKLNFTFPDTKGNKVSISDPYYRGKVVIVQILGSWCPNCMDETAFLSDYYQQNKQKGLEIIGLAYERTDNFNESKKALEPFQNRFQVKYPFLITGVTPSDPEKTEKTLPQIDHINAFPTTLFIDKKGIIRKIHTGFDGPGTGKYYEEFKEEFEKLVTRLLNEN